MAGATESLRISAATYTNAENSGKALDSIIDSLEILLSGIDEIKDKIDDEYSQTKKDNLNQRLNTLKDKLRKQLKEDDADINRHFSLVKRHFAQIVKKFENRTAGSKDKKHKEQFETYIKDIEGRLRVFREIANQHGGRRATRKLKRSRRAQSRRGRK